VFYSFWVLAWATIGLVPLSACFAAGLVLASRQERVPWFLRLALPAAVIAGVAGGMVVQADFWFRKTAQMATGFAYGVVLGLLFVVGTVAALAVVRPLRRRNGLPDRWA
jgi:hypothetical protein